MKDIISKINQISKTFDNKVRLGIMSILMVNDRVDFNTLKSMLDSSDGKLASHLKTLENEEYIDVRKKFVGKKPNTSYAATELGRKAFNDHLDALQKLLEIRD